MHMKIRGRNCVSIKLRGSIERRLRFVLGRFEGRIGRVTVLFTEVNGALGKTVKQCKVVVQLVSSGEVCVEETDSTWQIVSDRATGRVGQAVQRALDRRHEGMTLYAFKGL